MWKRFKDWFNEFNENRQKEPKKFKYLVGFFILSFLIVILFEQYLISLQPKPEEIEYTEYERLLEDDKIDIIKYDPTSSDKMTLYLQNEDTKIMTLDEKKTYVYPIEDTKITLYPANEDFRKEVLAHNVYLVWDKSANTAEILSFLLSIAFPVIMIILFYNIMKKSGSVDKEDDLLQTSSVKFTDVIGLDEILGDVQFITKLINKPDMCADIGARVPKGILLCGEPGTGKTLIARAIAGEAGVPFIYANASSFIEMFVGLGAKRVRNVLPWPRKMLPVLYLLTK